MSTNLYDLPADAMVRCIATIISAPEIYSSGARLSQAMAVFRTCKRMHAVLSDEAVWKDILAIHLPWVSPHILDAWHSSALTWRAAATSMMPLSGLHGVHYIEDVSLPTYVAGATPLPPSETPAALRGEHAALEAVGEDWPSLSPSGCRGGIIFIAPTQQGVSGHLIVPAMGSGSAASEDNLVYVKNFVSVEVLHYRVTPGGAASNALSTRILQRTSPYDEPALEKLPASDEKILLPSLARASMATLFRAPPTVQNQRKPSLMSRLRSYFGSPQSEYSAHPGGLVPNPRAPETLTNKRDEDKGELTATALMSYRASLISHGGSGADTEPAAAAAACEAAWIDGDLPVPAGVAVMELLTGIWMGEYGSHGNELLHLSSHSSAATTLSTRGPGQVIISSHSSAATTLSTRGPGQGRGTPEMPSVDMVGLKVTGDPNVPSGQATFCVTAHGAERTHQCRCRYECSCPLEHAVVDRVTACFTAQLQTAMHGFVNPRWNGASIALLRNGELLLIWNNVHSRRLRRLVPSPDGQLPPWFPVCKGFPWGTVYPDEQPIHNTGEVDLGGGDDDAVPTNNTVMIQGIGGIQMLLQAELANNPAVYALVMQEPQQMMPTQEAAEGAEEEGTDIEEEEGGVEEP